MKEFDLLNAMNELDDKYLLEAEQPAVKVTKSKRIWKRTALIAACLCLVLAGTVLAASGRGFVLQIFDSNEEFTRPDERESSPIVGGHWASSSVRVPVSEISEEVKELEKSGKRRVAFSSWTEMEETLGLNVVNNPLLENLAKGWVTFHDFDEQGNRKVHAYMNIYPDVKQINMSADYEMYGTLRVGLTASIATDLLEEDRTGGYGYPYTEEQLNASTQEEYLMANGQTAFIFYGPMMQENGDTMHNDTLFKAYFQGENALVMLNAQDSREISDWKREVVYYDMTDEEVEANNKMVREETLERLKRILDAFE